MQDYQALPDTLDKLGEAEQDSQRHYIRMLELEEERRLLKAAFAIEDARLQTEWHMAQRRWVATLELAKNLTALADRLCS